MKKLITNAVLENKLSQREVKNQQLAKKIAEESIVLLHNNDTLPLAPCRVALYGIGAAINIKGGTGSGEVNERHCIGIQEGLEQAGFTVTTEDWLENYRQVYEAGKASFGKSLLRRMMFGSADEKINIMGNPYHYPYGRKLTEQELAESDAEACIYVLARQAGECADRSLERYDYEPAPEELHNLRLAAKRFKKLIVVVNAGGSMDLSTLEIIDGIGAILFFCQQGMEGGAALSSVLTGKVSPSGCLTDTWAQRYSDIPFSHEYSYLSGDTNEEDYHEGIFVGYRYFDSFSKPVRYPFGYGLSYTNFSLTPLKLINKASIISVTMRVTNIGSQYTGKKVVQLYMQFPICKLEREYQALVGFAKSRELSPGESADLTVSFAMEDFAAYDESRSVYVLEPGEYALAIGHDSRDTTVCGAVRIEQEVITQKCKNLCGPNRSFELLHAPSQHAMPLPTEIPKVSLVSSDFIHSIQPKKELPPNHHVETLLTKLTYEEKLGLVMGTGIMGADPMFTVPGSAAYTLDIPEKGIANMVLCDGPAGLRLQKTSVKQKNGKLKPAEVMMEFMNYLPSFILKFILANPQKGTPMYQYATAFPVGTALAQTWNEELWTAMGDAVGREMEEYGVTFWLAPGMNIHRNPLCGRNYEYFSEDPILTGKCAAAITRGVQIHPGCIVTIKHYLGNNQETNRNLSSSNIHERALREIYAKGFGIAVREGNAGAVMTGYNKVNGVYTSASLDYLQTLLREEFGFDGLIMTDWMATSKGFASNGASIHAGVDLIMPGGKEYRKQLEDDLKTGVVSIKEIDQACRRVLGVLLESYPQKRFFSVQSK